MTGRPLPELQALVCAPPTADRVEADWGIEYSGPEGRFSAHATGWVAGEQVRLAVLDPAGETTAGVRLQAGRLRIQRVGHPVEVWQSNWRGIPNAWLSIAMLGRWPCPRESEARWSLAQDETELIARVGDLAEYHYEFSEDGGRLLPKTLVYRVQIGAPQVTEVRLRPDGLGGELRGPEHRFSFHRLSAR